MSKKLFVLLLIAALLLPLVVTNGEAYAAAGTKLTVKNKSGAPIQLTLNGPKQYSYPKVKNGVNKFVVEPGVYYYTHNACGKNNTGRLDLTKPFVLLIDKCPPGPITIKVVNKTGGMMRMQLTGPASYNFNLSPGDNNLTVIPGKYRYEVFGCGDGYAKGRVNIKIGMRPWIWFCR